MLCHTRPVDGKVRTSTRVLSRINFSRLLPPRTIDSLDTSFRPITSSQHHRVHLPSHLHRVGHFTSRQKRCTYRRHKRASPPNIPISSSRNSFVIFGFVLRWSLSYLVFQPVKKVMKQFRIRHTPPFVSHYIVDGQRLNCLFRNVITYQAPSGPRVL